MADTNTTILVPEKPAAEAPALSAEEQLSHANGQPGTKTIPTDEYIQKREEARKERRGGVQYKIDKLTKQATEAKKSADEMAAKLAAMEQKQAVPPVVATPAVAPAVPDKPDPRPKREDFQDDTSHTTAIAEWVVRQQNKIVGAAVPVTPAAPEPPKEIQFNPQDPVHVQLKKEFDGFLFAGQDFIKRNPDFNDRLNAASAKGLTLNNQAQRAIIRLAAPEVLYYLADPQNEQEARKLMNMDGDGQIVEIARIAERLKVKPSDYVSSAPPPGQKNLTNGNTRATIPRDQMDPDDYIKMRIQERRSSKFRH